MNPFLSNPTFVVYAITSLVLVGDLMFLWGYSGVTRSKSGTAINEEDSAAFRARLEPIDPPGCARVLRAHRNAEASIYPFLILGLIFVLAGGSVTTAEIVFGIFTVARLLHTGFYLAGKQPWRTICFAAGGLAIVALMVCIVILLIR
jgi:uncharacterized MAPEG superfamily protein